jgi:hypothetical protein
MSINRDLCMIRYCWKLLLQFCSTYLHWGIVKYLIKNNLSTDIEGSGRFR